MYIYINLYLHSFSLHLCDEFAQHLCIIDCSLIINKLDKNNSQNRLKRKSLFPTLLRSERGHIFRNFIQLILHLELNFSNK